MEQTWKTDKIKVYKWSSTTDAKVEYDEWFATLTEACSKEKIGFCVDETFADQFIPKTPDPQVDNSAASRLAFRKEKVDYDKAMIEYRNKFLQATGYLKSTLLYGSKARMEIDAILAKKPDPPLNPEGQPDPNFTWTTIDAFKAAMKYLKDTYAPSDATDVATLKQKIAELNDEVCGGFAPYAEQFTTLHCALVRANQEPDAKACTAWVLKGIRNQEVSRSVICALFKPDDPNHEPTFREIFKFVETFLKRSGDNDPYKTAKTNPFGPARVAANAATRTDLSEKRCTKCWRRGHVWSKCLAVTCSVCGRPFDGAAFCSGWMTHNEMGTKWIPAKFKDDGKRDEKESGKRKTPPEEDPNVLEKVKLLKAARKEVKRARFEAKKKE
jgi:hypothetical protein